MEIYIYIIKSRIIIIIIIKSKTIICIIVIIKYKNKLIYIYQPQFELNQYYFVNIFIFT